MKRRFIPTMRRSAFSEIFTNTVIALNIHTCSITIRIFDDISSIVFPRVGVNTFFVIMFPNDGAKFCFILKQKEIVIKVHTV